MATATWLLQTTTATTVATTATQVSGSVPFERRGLLLPVQRDQKQDFANGTDAEVIASNVEQILGTRCSDGTVPGELPWLGAFGSLLYKLRHQLIKPVIRYQARAYVVDALARWEPRVRVVAVRVDEEPRKLIIRTAFIIVEGYSVGRVDDEPIEVETQIQRAA